MQEVAEIIAMVLFALQSFGKPKSETFCVF